jgi:hypothetical protein
MDTYVVVTVATVCPLFVLLLITNSIIVYLGIPLNKSITT